MCGLVWIWWKKVGGGFESSWRKAMSGVRGRGGRGEEGGGGRRKGWESD